MWLTYGSWMFQTPRYQHEDDCLCCYKQNMVSVMYKKLLRVLDKKYCQVQNKLQVE